MTFRKSLQRSDIKLLRIHDFPQSSAKVKEIFDQMLVRHQKYLQIEAEIPLWKFLNANFEFLLQLKFSQTLLLNHDGANLFDPC